MSYSNVAFHRVPTFEVPGGHPGGQASHSVPPSPYNRGGIPPHPYSTLPPSPYNTIPPSPVTPTILPSPHKAMAPSSLCNTKTPSPHCPYATSTTKRSPYQTIPEVQPLRYNMTSIPQPSPGGVYGMVTSHTVTPATPRPTESETVAATSSYFSAADEEEVSHIAELV